MSNLPEVIKLIEDQIAGAERHIQSESNELIRGTDTEYKRGGIAMGKGILQLLKTLVDTPYPGTPKTLPTALVEIDRLNVMLQNAHHALRIRPNLPNTGSTPNLPGHN